MCAIITCLCLIGASALAQPSGNGPSFSCRGVGGDSVEGLICGDASLARQDRAMARAYGAARRAVAGSEGYGALYTNQLAFLRERAACAQLRTQKAYCVADLTQKRLNELEQWTIARAIPVSTPPKAPKTGTTQASRPPTGPSFNCNGNISNVLRTICQDRALSLLDRQMAEALAIAYRTTPRAGHAALAREQSAFVANRERCAQRQSDRSMCITVAYEMRIARLGEWATGTQ